MLLGTIDKEGSDDERRRLGDTALATLQLDYEALTVGQVVGTILSVQSSLL